MTLFDAHTHIHFPVYDLDREEVFGRAKEVGVKMITVGTQYTSSREAVEYAKAHKGDVWATVGFHPAHFSANWYHDKNEQKGNEREILDIGILRNLAREPEVVAIGECGLDYFRVTDQGSRVKQQEGFIKQIELAHELKKPLMIHCRSGLPERTSPRNEAGRSAFSDLIEILKANSPASPAGRSKLKTNAPGAIHFFSGTKEDAKKLLNLGFVFTFGGVITFPPRLAERSRGEAGASDYDEVIKTLPLEAILSETDAPYVAPAPYRGKRNEPAYVVEVVKKLAELREISAEKMAEQISRNAKRVFGV